MYNSGMKLLSILFFISFASTGYATNFKCHAQENSNKTYQVSIQDSGELLYKFYYKKELKVDQLFTNSNFEYVTPDVLNIKAFSSEQSVELYLQYLDRMSGESLPGQICYTEHCFDVICDFKI